MSDAFDLLGLEPNFRLDAARLERAHRDLSATLHPDRYLGRPAAERRAALGKAIEVNAARTQLQQPLARGELLLARLGAKLEPAVDQEFLMEVMGLREALREAGASHDEPQVEALSQEVKERQAGVEKQLGELFAQAMAAGGPPDPEISRLLSQLRYFERFLVEAEALLDEMF